MKFDVENFVDKLNPCYVDESGNFISVVGFDSEDVAKVKEIADDAEDWCVARISAEGDIEVIEFFKDADTAEDALHAICRKNNWQLRRD